MLAAATGVTDGNARHAVADVDAALDELLERGRPALLDRAVEHLRLERVDDREDELLRRAHRRMRRPSYFSLLRRRGRGRAAATKRRRATKPSGGNDDREAASSERDHVAVRRSSRRRRAAGVEPRACAREEAGARVPVAERGAGRPERAARSSRRAALGERAGEQQRAERDRSERRRSLHAVGAARSATYAGGPPAATSDGEERDRLEEREVGAGEVDAEVRARRARRPGAAGGTGATPVAPASPAPWPMSRESASSRARYAEARMTIDDSGAGARR